MLDVGSGSGWSTALLAHLTGPTGEVVGVELLPELVTFGRANLARAKRPWARIEAADPDTSRLAGRGAVRPDPGRAEPRELPGELVEQLAADGRMVIPVAGSMLLVRATGDGPEVSHHGSYRFVPLL